MLHHAAAPAPDLATSGSPPFRSHRFRAMHTDVLVVARNDALARDGQRIIENIETRFSRFLPDSELSRFNARTRPDVAVSAEMAALIALSQGFARRTGGLFDPAVLPQLEAAGYDRSFEQVPRDGTAAAARPFERHTIDELQLDRANLRCVAPPGLRLDFGGIGKGFAVDTAARRLAPSRDFLVDAGGDVFASGNGPDGPGWRVGVADPDGGADVDAVTLRDAAIATSSRAGRRWRRGDRWLHHIIDPRNGEPACTPTVSASVVAGTATEADVYAKCALMLAPDAALAFVEARRAAALLVLEDGTSVATTRWPGRTRPGLHTETESGMEREAS